jgi:hypothetical protein
VSVVCAFELKENKIKNKESNTICDLFILGVFLGKN